MNVGMMWLDDDGKRSIEEKVSRAVEYYQEKYGRLPEICFVNQAMLAVEKHVGKVTVQPNNTILPHHFWLGMEAS
ncbi:hypothetical protein MNBD_CHLOROFLEXI01-1629 [hydrothermal vent metagenome]|uniref:Uncharacterized protein n=1 Tax=hydrothermal vent metagenome TaxID=652676 RepID=A0A3B0VHF0_9ZZZZ